MLTSCELLLEQGVMPQQPEKPGLLSRIGSTVKKYALPLAGLGMAGASLALMGMSPTGVNEYITSPDGSKEYLNDIQKNNVIAANTETQNAYKQAWDKEHNSGILSWFRKDKPFEPDQMTRAKMTNDADTLAAVKSRDYLATHVKRDVMGKPTNYGRDYDPSTVGAVLGNTIGTGLDKIAGRVPTAENSYTNKISQAFTMNPENAEKAGTLRNTLYGVSIAGSLLGSVGGIGGAVVNSLRGDDDEQNQQRRMQIINHLRSQGISDVQIQQLIQSGRI